MLGSLTGESIGYLLGSRYGTWLRTSRVGRRLVSWSAVGAVAWSMLYMEIPVRLTEGSESPPVFPRVIDRLAQLIPRVTRETIDGAAHAPQLQIPERYVEVTKRALQASG